MEKRMKSKNDFKDAMDLEDIKLILAISYRTKCIVMIAKQSGEL